MQSRKEEACNDEDVSGEEMEEMRSREMGDERQVVARRCTEKEKGMACGCGEASSKEINDKETGYRRQVMTRRQATEPKDFIFYNKI